MNPLPRLTLADQTAAHLRERLRSGQWGDKVPGVVRLGAELQVSQTTVRAALRVLEAEGLIADGGCCRGRQVAAGKGRGARRGLSVGILLHDARPEGQPKSTPLIPDTVVLSIQNALEAAGHAVFFPRQSQVELHHDVGRITRHLRQTPADAWIVVSGSRELLEWFAGQPVPSLALYGRSSGLPIARAGPDKEHAYRAAVSHLVALGHRSIVNISRSTRRKPIPGRVEQAFLAELAAHGIQTGDFNLPEWEETPAGFSALLTELFRFTPPTALIIEETSRFVAASQFLARRGIKVPEQVSLVCTDYDESLTWCHPPVAHMTWSNQPFVQRIVRWASAVRGGRNYQATTLLSAEFVPGGSTGPVWEG
jgi:DNA-binding LacI/PurR family transcriptional regulator